MRNLAFLIVIAWLILTGCYQKELIQKQSKTLDSFLLPSDSSIIIDRLDNGLGVYIKKNREPENRAELRLIIKAGSMMEEENQRGLAHFVEHMAFNGTEKYKKHEIIDYLELMGMKYGPEINAYTSFLRTVYMLQIPTDTLGAVKKGLDILHEWAFHIAFDSLEIEKERGVIKEEWRLRRGASSRMLEGHFPVLLKGTLFPRRLPIGDTTVIDTFKHETLVSFYKKWYRPNLMAVAVVGDVDPDSVKQWITELFSHQESSQTDIPLPDFNKSLPDSNRFSIIFDKEATQTNFSLYHFEPFDTMNTINDYAEYTIYRMINRMINKRFYEILQTNPDPPYQYANISKGSFLDYWNVTTLNLGVKSEKLSNALKTIKNELHRISRDGFLEEEFLFTKNELIKFMQRIYNERNHRKSASFISGIIDHFVLKEPIISVETKYRLLKSTLDTLSQEYLHSLLPNYLNWNPFVVLIGAPESDSAYIPSGDSILNLLTSAISDSIPQYVSTLTSLDLMVDSLSYIPPKKIEKDSVLGVTKLILDNGMKVIIKKTDFKDDEILFYAFSEGGLSCVDDNEFLSASVAPSVWSQSGLGEYSYLDLTKLLSDKMVLVRPFLSDYYEGFRGQSSKKDLETLFQLIYLNMSAPRIDSTVYQSYLNRLKGYLIHKEKNPESIYNDTINYYLYNNHYRMRPWDTTTIAQIKFEEIKKVHEQRFLNHDLFTFIFVGNVEPDTISKYAGKYLNALPKVKYRDTIVDRKIDYHSGALKKTVFAGLEPKSKVSLFFTGAGNYSFGNSIKLEILTDLLEMKLREIIREDESGTYSIRVRGSHEKYFDQEFFINISFGCAPENVEKLTGKVLEVIDSIRIKGTNEIYLEKIKNIFFKDMEEELKENSFWLSVISGIEKDNLPVDYISGIKKIYDEIKMEDIIQLANQYFNMNNVQIFILKPEIQGESEQ
ncbi:MAG: insulinase family protein [Calditrichia bacterium]